MEDQNKALPEAFISPRLTGRRFDDHTVPLEILEDFASFEDLLIEVAKSIYLEENGRKRVPNGFTDGVQLKLESIGEGSSRLKIILVAASMAVDIAHASYFQKAKDKIVACIGAAENNRPITGIIPDNLLLYFNQIGKRLKQDEAINFETSSGTEAKLNNVTREKLVLASSASSEITRQVRVIATIPSLDKEKRTYTIRLESSPIRLVRDIEGVHSATINEAFANFDEGAKVAIVGAARFSRSEKLLDFDYVEHISILDPLDIPLRMQELSILQDGWLGEDSVAPSKENLSLLAELFDSHYDYSLPLPYLYPTPEGGVQAEWRDTEYDISLTVDFGAKSAYFNSLNLVTDGNEEFDLKIDDPHAWENLNLTLHRILAV